MSNNRKDDHIKYALKQSKKNNTFDSIVFESDELSGLNLNDIDLKTKFLGFDINYPIYINAMTGGSELAYKINDFLSKIASHFNFPFVTGSQSAYLKNNDLKDSFEIIRKNYKGIVVSNINPNYDIEDATKSINLLNSDAISIHLNMLQELAMKEGDRDFSSWSNNIKSVLDLKIPVLVKSVGTGLSNKTINKLINLGVKHIDVSGSGGTSFIDIEAKRSNKDYSYLETFSIDTAEILINKPNNKEITYYASGGIRNAFDVIKALRLGAQSCGLSRWFLDLYGLELNEAINKVDEFIEDMKKIMIVLGVKNITELRTLEYKIK